MIVGTSPALCSFTRMPIVPNSVAPPSNIRASSDYARTALGNDFLSMLSSQEPETFSRLKADLEEFKLNVGAVLQHSGIPITHVYFPTSGVVSCAVPLEEDRKVTTYIIGHDGAVNIDPECGNRAYFTCTVEISGYALRLRSETWRAALRQSSGLCRQVAGYLYRQVVQSQQMVACNVAHDVESRLCRWLLRLHDYSDRGMIAVTHQSLARLMSVRRTTVTLVARGLHDAGIIRYRRGQIEVLDRYALETAACECHEAASTRLEAV
jgi:CRP-like cAMP-binding protein